MRIGLLYNPLGGRNRSGGLAPLLKVAVGDRRIRVRGGTTPVQMAGALAELAADGVDLLVVSGGDGTLQVVLTELIRERPFAVPPRLAVLASGTTNMSAGDLGLRGRPHRALARLLLALGDAPRWGRGEAEVLRRPLLQVRPAPGRPLQYGLFLGAAGILQGMRFYREQLHDKGIRGELGPALTTARAFYHLLREHSGVLRPEAVRVALDGEQAQGYDCLVLFVTTLERFFMGLRPFWGEGPGALRFTLIRHRPRHLLRAARYLLRGRSHPRLSPEDGYTSRNAKRVELFLEHGFSLDGEVFESEPAQGPVQVAVGPTLEFVR
jgi:diacylglycerol kinase (ATP)